MGIASTTTWAGIPIRVTARMVSRYAWLTTSIDVMVNGRTVLQTGGVMKAVGVHSETVDLAGSHRRVDLSWRPFENGSFPFSLAIDGTVVLESRVAPPFWWVSFWPYAALVLLGVVLAEVFA